jgi:hypothetical protein
VNKAEEKLLAEGYEGVTIFENFSYDTALIGVTEDNRAVYDYDLMVKWLIDVEGFDDEMEAIEWIEYNTIRALAYAGEKAPVIVRLFYGVQFVESEVEDGQADSRDT